MKIKRKTKKLIKELKNMESGIFKFSDGKYIYQSLDEYLGSLYKENERLNKIIEEIETIFDTPYFDMEVSKQLGSEGFFTFKQMYKACNIVFKKRLQELKEEGKE